MGIALLALAVRLPQLGVRPMHTDEAVNAYLTGQLLAGEKYRYDPKDRHGPALVEFTLPLVRLEGAKQFPDLTEAQLRLVTVLAGSATILLFGAATGLFGFIPCLVAALLFAFAPLPVYYSRYFIHETLFVAASFGFILAGAVLAGGRAGSRGKSGLCQVGQPATNSTANQNWDGIADACAAGKNCRGATNSTCLAVLAGGCAALMLAGKETAGLHFLAFAVAVVIAWRLRPPGIIPPVRVWLVAGASFLGAGILLITWGGQSWQALADLFRALPHLAARAGGEGHEKPFWYYLVLLADGWSGRIILGLSLVGIFRATRSFPRLVLLAYAILIQAVYWMIPYKTPWLALNIWLPLALLAGFAVEWMWGATGKLIRRAALVTGCAALGLLIARDTRERVFVHPAGESNPYAYSSTSEDLAGLPVRLAELARQNHTPNPRIAVIAADAWPLPWYLRKFSTVGFWQPGQNAGAADFFITSTDVFDPLAGQLKDFRPEFFGVRANVLVILWVPIRP